MSLWKFHGIGSSNHFQDLPITGNVKLKLFPKLDLKQYYEFIKSYDVGLSLMLSPHPSLVPLDLAGAGIITVTNTFANKSSKSLEHISGNIIPAEPSIDTIVAALETAVSRTENFESRITNAHLKWAEQLG